MDVVHAGHPSHESNAPLKGLAVVSPRIFKSIPSIPLKSNWSWTNARVQNIESNIESHDIDRHFPSVCASLHWFKRASCICLHMGVCWQPLRDPRQTHRYLKRFEPCLKNPNFTDLCVGWSITVFQRLVGNVGTWTKFESHLYFVWTCKYLYFLVSTKIQSKNCWNHKRQ